MQFIYQLKYAVKNTFAINESKKAPNVKLVNIFIQKEKVFFLKTYMYFSIHC